MKLYQLSGKDNTFYLPMNINKENCKEEIDQAIVLIKKAIKDGKQIGTVIFYGSSFKGISTEQLQLLFGEIKNAEIQSIDLTSVALNDTSISEIEEIFKTLYKFCKNGASCKKINLSKNSIGEALLEKQKLIVQGLIELSSVVKELDLSSNELGKIDIDLLKKLFKSCAQSEKLKILKLDHNQLAEQRYYDENSQEYLDFFEPLFDNKRFSNKWEFLSLRSTGIGFLSNKEWEVLLAKIEKCCNSINLSQNSLQEQTSEGRLDPFEEEDLIHIIAKWIKITKLVSIDLTNNGFSVRNTAFLKDLRKDSLSIDNGNNSPNNILYNKLLQQKNSEELEEALDIKTKHYGTCKHINIATTLGNLANKYDELGDIKQQKNS